MLILLPPSEGKTAPTSGDPLDLDSLWAPELSGLRSDVLNDLVSVSQNDPDSLGAPKGARAQVAANVDLWSAPTAPAAQVYTGVLFSALGFATLPAPARERSANSVLIASPLYGFVSPTNRIAAYRLPPTAKLPTVGNPLAYLASSITGVLNAQKPNVVLDARSGPYVRLWRPDVPWVHVKAVEIREGVPKVVSHFAKHHRGILARHVLQREAPLPMNVSEVLAAAEELLGIEYQKVALIEGPPGSHVLELTLI